VCIRELSRALRSLPLVAALPLSALPVPEVQISAQAPATQDAGQEAAAQDAAHAAASVSLPDSSIRAIADDFDAGRNPIYCFHGEAGAAGAVRIARVTTVPTPAQCDGIGIGFISRIDDPAFLGGTIKGLMDSNARFRIISAFYRTEIVNDGGRPMRAPRALSVIRGVASSKALQENAHERRVRVSGS
jgi:hypothetical protein